MGNDKLQRRPPSAPEDEAIDAEFEEGPKQLGPVATQREKYEAARLRVATTVLANIVKRENMTQGHVAADVGIAVGYAEALLARLGIKP